MFTTTVMPVRAETISWRRLLVGGAGAAIGAVVANGLIYVAAAALGAMPQTVVVRPNQPITLFAVVGTTISSVVGAKLVLALLKQVTHRPLTIFHIVAGVVLALSFATPFTIANAPIAMVVSLDIMHIITAMIVVYMLNWATRTSLPQMSPASR
jgi:RsiW-degrading membrane proteinase PrsW (M82 family)